MGWYEVLKAPEKRRSDYETKRLSEEKQKHQHSVLRCVETVDKSLKNSVCFAYQIDGLQIVRHQLEIADQFVQ